MCACPYVGMGVLCVSVCTGPGWVHPWALGRVSTKHIVGPGKAQPTSSGPRASAHPPPRLSCVDVLDDTTSSLLLVSRAL